MAQNLTEVLAHEVETEYHNRYRGSLDQLFDITLNYKGIGIDISGEYGGYGEDDVDMVDIKVFIDTTDNNLIREVNEIVLKYKIESRHTVEDVFDWVEGAVEGAMFDINSARNSASLT